MPRVPFKRAATLMIALMILAARRPLPGLAGGAALASGDAAQPVEAAAMVQPNVMKANVWAGLYGKYFNGPFTTVQICQSGTTNCEEISGILIDTGSFGLRIFPQANHLTLATETAHGDTIAECVQFETLSTWGRVAYADLTLGGEPTISKLLIQIINPNFPPMPAARAARARRSPSASSARLHWQTPATRRFTTSPERLAATSSTSDCRSSSVATSSPGSTARSSPAQAPARFSPIERRAHHMAPRSG